MATLHGLPSAGIRRFAVFRKIIKFNNLQANPEANEMLLD
jgi:hypothetical protein